MQLYVGQDNHTFRILASTPYQEVESEPAIIEVADLCSGSALVADALESPAYLRPFSDPAVISIDVPKSQLAIDDGHSDEICGSMLYRL